ncbi:DUF726 domain-containing protein [Vibrio breoganii]
MKKSMAERISRASKLHREVKSSTNLYQIPKDFQMKTADDYAVDMKYVRSMSKRGVSNQEIELYLQDIKAEFRQKGVALTDNMLLRELACRSGSISCLSDYQKLLWDPKQPVVNENSSKLSKLKAKHMPFGRLDNFSISRVDSNGDKNKGPNVIVINGFLSEGGSDTQDWLSAINDSKYSLSAVYHLNWDAGQFFNFNEGLVEKLSMLALNETAKKNIINSLTAVVAGVLTPASLSIYGTLISSVLTTWYDALHKTEKAGQALSYAIQCCDDDKGYVVMGHSLGARVIFYLLQDLSEVKKRLINKVFLLGGAIDSEYSIDSWEGVESAVQESIYNVYSKHDKTLKLLYQLTTVGMSNPIGITPISSKKKSLIRNYDASGRVNGNDSVDAHMEHKDKLNIDGIEKACS